MPINVRQKTLAKAVPFSGVGIHSGKITRLVIKPAPADSGVVFVRTDIPGRAVISAIAKNGQESARATTLADNGATVHTVEHFLSALHALAVDNAVIEMDGIEPPILDGGAGEIVRALDEAGFVEEKAPRRYTTLTAPIAVYGENDHEQMLIALPYDGLRISFTSINPHPLIGTQFFDITVTPESYAAEIAPARTIAYEKEVAALHAAGLGLGGSLENTIVYNDAGWLTPLRFPDELVRHKMLDIIGDLRLAGLVKAHVIAVKSSHALNGRLAKKIAAMAE